MEGTNTTNTQNENSNNYLLSPEEEKKLMAITVGCPVVATSQKDVAPEGFETTCKDITSATIVAARKIEDNVKPSKQGDSIVPVTAAEFKDGVSLVVKDGRLVQAPKTEKNATLQASEDRRKIQESAEDKYAKNNPTSPEGR